MAAIGAAKTERTDSAESPLRPPVLVAENDSEKARSANPRPDTVDALNSITADVSA